MNTTSTQIFHDAHVAGGWTGSDTVARRLCSALWKATGAFTRIENYHADVVLDYVAIEEAVSKLEPGCSMSFIYGVGRNGTHLALNSPGRSIVSYESHVKAVLEDDRGGNSAKFAGSIVRSDYLTNEFLGTKYGADKYALTIETVEVQS